MSGFFSGATTPRADLVAWHAQRSTCRVSVWTPACSFPKRSIPCLPLLACLLACLHLAPCTSPRRSSCARRTPHAATGPRSSSESIPVQATLDLICQWPASFLTLLYFQGYSTRSPIPCRKDDSTCSSTMDIGASQNPYPVRPTGYLIGSLLAVSKS
jgi:hypothetical protein